MAKIGAQRAAELTGKSKSTIQRAMKNGKISYEMDHNDRRVIDVAELERAFGLIPQESDQVSGKAVEAELEKATQMLEMERLKIKLKTAEEQLEGAREQIEDLKEQRNQWQKQAQQVLLTSQYSQKQAEELKEELKERERRAKARRQQEVERRAQKGTMKSDNENRQPVSAEQQGQDVKPFDIQGLWHKIRGQNDTGKEQEKERASA